MATRPSIRGLWRDDLPARGVYAEAAGIHRMVPIAVAVPADAADVEALVRWAAGSQTSLTPRGSGSSMAGGAVGSGVIVDLSRLDQLGPIEAATRSIVVGPGAICDRLARHSAPHRLRLPVDPSSAAFCTIGGMASTNAAGGRTLRYGQMNAWVRGIECVFATGERAWIRSGQPLPRLAAIDRFAAVASRLRSEEKTSPSRHAGVRKESSGYGLAAWSASGDLVDLLVGSEGTLAIFTALEIQLNEVPPFTGTLVAAFESLDDAVRAAAIATELNASACELLDRTFLDVARAGGGHPVPDGEAVLIVELEEKDTSRLDQLLAAVTAAFESAGASSIRASSDPEQASGLWGLRHAASPILAAMSDVTSMQIIEDGAVPPSQLAEYVRGVRAILEASRFKGVIFGHAGDGHVHVNVLVDVREADWHERIDRVFSDAVSLIRQLGGTMTGEHGDGRLRAGAMSRLWPAEALGRFRVVKSAFDPDGILNPGVKFPVADAPVLGASIKYDPSIEPLPASSRHVLDRVQRERAWNRSRLDLLGEELQR